MGIPLDAVVCEAETEEVFITLCPLPCFLGIDTVNGAADTLPGAENDAAEIVEPPDKPLTAPGLTWTGTFLPANGL